MTTRFSIVPLSLALLIACSPADRGEEETADSGGASAAAPAAADRVLAWSCSDGSTLVTEFYDATDRIAIRGTDDAVELAHVVAASGAKYSDGTLTFWTKGEEALYELGDGTSLDCTVDRYRSNLEAAKLAGFQFRAVGNEPGWSLLVGREQIVWETDYGETRHEFAAPEPVSPNDSSTVWQTEVDGQPWALTLSEGPCFDDMSGEEFATAVQIEFGDRTYRGCGHPLR